MTAANVTLFPMPEFGHVNAMLVIARKLKARGHRVSWICPIAPVRNHLEGNGFEVLPLPAEVVAEAECVAEYLSAPPGTLLPTLVRKLREGTLQEYRKYIAEVRRSLTDILCGTAIRDALVQAKTNLFLCDASWTPPAMVAHSLGIRTLLLSTTLPMMKLPALPPIDRGLVADGSLVSRVRAEIYWQRVHARRLLYNSFDKLGVMINEQAAARRAAVQWGFDPRTINFDFVHQFGPNLPLPRLILCSREFDYDFVSGHDLHYIGPNIDLARQDVAFPWDRLESGKRTIYCSLGTVAVQVAKMRSFFERVIEAFRRRSDWQLMLNVGAGLQPDSFSGLPESAIVVQHTPQLELLKRTAVMLAAGGFNSIKECILLGTSFVAFPMRTSDQPGNAARLRAHGIALTGDIARATPAQIADLIERTLGDTAMRARLERMQAVFKRDQESDLALETIDRLSLGALTGSPTSGVGGEEPVRRGA